MAILNKNSIWNAIIKDAIVVTEATEAYEQSLNWSLSQIKWIWPATIKQLVENGINDISHLRAVWEVAIKKIVSSPIALKWILDFLNSDLWTLEQ